MDGDSDEDADDHTHEEQVGEAGTDERERHALGREDARHDAEVDDRLQADEEQAAGHEQELEKIRRAAHVPAAGGRLAARAATGEVKLQHDGRERRYLISDFSGGKPAPVVFVLHGGGGHPENAQNMSQFDVIAAESDHYNLRVPYVNALHDGQQMNAMLMSLGRGLTEWLR